ncbi:hypothetical protein Bca4012_022275 [Brassica carinata]
MILLEMISSCGFKATVSKEHVPIEKYLLWKEGKAKIFTTSSLSVSKNLIFSGPFGAAFSPSRQGTTNPTPIST